MKYTTWKELLEQAMRECPEDILYCTQPENLMKTRFGDGYGELDIPKFIAWTEKHIYYGDDYDGAAFVGRLPRNPPKEK